MKLSYFTLLFLTLYAHQSNSMIPWDISNLSQNLQNVRAQIKQALKNKSNLDAPLNTLSKNSALHEALDKYPLHDLVEPLLQTGANPNHKSPLNQWAPLHYVASDKDEISYLRLLLKYKADVNVTNTNYETPLMLAVKKGNYEGAQLLLEHGANPNAQNTSGDTAPHNICRFKIDYDYNPMLRENMVKLLLRHGANPCIKNRWDKTALDLARENGFDKLAQLMENQRVRLAKQLLIILEKAGVAADINIAQRIADFVYSSHA